ncbi:MAG: glycosyltransferase [Putridiphycobacter sp.]|nr:glycosyltransferase [Putridiphycobacter sp.]
MKDKKKILICVDWYTPGFKAGGPIRSVANMVEEFKKDYDFYILTSAYDLGDYKPYKNVVLNQWHDQNGVFIKYLDKSCLNYPTIKGNIYEVDPDVMYLNSLFSKNFTLYPLRFARKFSKKVVLAPRGMLGKGALEIKQSKKQIFLSIAKILGWYKNVIWHASTHEEVEEIQHVFGEHSKIKIAQNIPVRQKYSLEQVKEFKKTGKVKFIFMSRISKKKNLHLAINALKSIKLDRAVEFDIYGINEDRLYFESFRKDIGKLSAMLTINYKGEVHPSKVPELFAKADYMLLPTMHENFGHTIVEAWANGCPVVLSQNTPWHNLEEKNVGWDVNIEEPDALANTLDLAIHLNFDNYMKKVEDSFNFFKDEVMDHRIIDDHKTLLSL